MDPTLFLKPASGCRLDAESGHPEWCNFLFGTKNLTFILKASNVVPIWNEERQTILKENLFNFQEYGLNKLTIICLFI